MKTDLTYRERRIRCACKSVRRAVDLVIHGGEAELINEDFADSNEAWLLLGAAVVNEVQDHGFVVKLDENGNAYLVREQDDTDTTGEDYSNIAAIKKRVGF